MRISVDIATALYNLLTEDNYSASAHSVPASLGRNLPHIHVARTGGYTSDLVIENNNVDFDVYADNEADAMTAASNLCEWVRSLVGRMVDTPCHVAEITTLPYNNPDPRHPNIPRATFKAEIIVRTKGVYNA